MTITFPSDTKDTIDAIRDAIGRDITFNINTGLVACTVSGCTLDPVTNVSTNSFCPTCGGEYWIATITGSVLTAHVRWASMDTEIRYPAGSVYNGDCRAQIEYSDANVTILDQTETVTVDDKLMSIDKIIYKGVPEINRIVLILNEEDTDG